MPSQWRSPLKYIIVAQCLAYKLGSRLKKAVVRKWRGTNAHSQWIVKKKHSVRDDTRRQFQMKGASGENDTVIARLCGGPERKSELPLQSGDKNVWNKIIRGIKGYWEENRFLAYNNINLSHFDFSCTLEFLYTSAVGILHGWWLIL